MTGSADKKLLTNSFTMGWFRTFAYCTVRWDHKTSLGGFPRVEWRLGDRDVWVNMTDGIRLKYPPMCCMFLRLSPCLVNKFLSTVFCTSFTAEQKSVDFFSQRNGAARRKDVNGKKIKSHEFILCVKGKSDSQRTARFEPGVESDWRHCRVERVQPFTHSERICVEGRRWRWKILLLCCKLSDQSSLDLHSEARGLDLTFDKICLSSCGFGMCVCWIVHFV